MEDMVVYLYPKGLSWSSCGEESDVMWVPESRFQCTASSQSAGHEARSLDSSHDLCTPVPQSRSYRRDMTAVV